MPSGNISRASPAERLESPVSQNSTCFVLIQSLAHLAAAAVSPVPT